MQTEPERYWSKVDVINGECWLWTASTNRDGYGQFRSEGKVVRAHQWSYEHLVGPVPDGLQLDHLCRVRQCVNPDHLEPVTLSTNLKRGAAARTHCLRGHPWDEENTYHRPNGGRDCRACKALRHAGAA